MRARPGLFSIKPGHALLDIDHVVAENERFAVVLVPGPIPERPARYR
jgi:hypothetical protein